MTCVVWPYCVSWWNLDLSINALYAQLWDVNIRMGVVDDMMYTMMG